MADYLVGEWDWTPPDNNATASKSIKQARKTLAQIEETTWGLTLREIEGERVVVLPAAALDYPPWTVGGRPAVEAVEKVKELYDRTRTAQGG